MTPPRSILLLRDLPTSIQRRNLTNLKQILELNDDLDKAVALQNYFHNNFMYEALEVSILIKKRAAQRLKKLIQKHLSECERKLHLLEQCVAHMKYFQTKYRTWSAALD